jgi:uncharacterized protein
MFKQLKFASRYGLGFFLLLLSMMVMAVVVPKLSNRVTDLTATLSVEHVVALENKLADFEAKKGNQIAVLIVPTTGTKDIGEFATEVADLSQIGRKGIDEGVILILAKDNQYLHLEVGYGLKDIIPDVIAQRIISETITPYLKKGDYAGAIEAGVIQLMKLIEGEALPAKSVNNTQHERLIICVLFGGLIAGFGLSTTMGRVMAGILAGLASGIVTVIMLNLTLSTALLTSLMVFLIIGVGPPNGHGGWSNDGGLRRWPF